MTFAPVDLQTPWLLYWAAAVAAVVGGFLALAGRWRERDHRRRQAAAGSHVVMRVLENTRLQRRVGYGALVLALAVAVWGAVAHVQGIDALRGNVRQKYGAEVEDVRQSGSGVTVDLVHPDGTREEDQYMAVEQDGEPVYGAELVESPPIGG